MPVQTNAKRHLDRGAALFVLGIELGAFFGQELDDVVGRLRAVMQGSFAGVANRVDVGAPRPPRASLLPATQPRSRNLW